MDVKELLDQFTLFDPAKGQKSRSSCRGRQLYRGVKGWL